MKAYTDVATVENYLLTEVSSSFEPQVETWIDAMSIYADTLADRRLIAEAEETMKFDGTRTTEMKLPDFQTITALSIGGEAIAEENYFLYPPNKQTKNRIVLKSGHFPFDRQNISVTAKFGLFPADAIPNDIAWAVTVFVAGIINRANTSGKEVSSESIGRYSVSYRAEKGWDDYKRATEIIKGYRRITF